MTIGPLRDHPPRAALQGSRRVVHVFWLAEPECKLVRSDPLSHGVGSTTQGNEVESAACTQTGRGAWVRAHRLGGQARSLAAPSRRATKQGENHGTADANVGDQVKPGLPAQQSLDSPR